MSQNSDLGLTFDFTYKKSGNFLDILKTLFSKSHKTKTKA